MTDGTRTVSPSSRLEKLTQDALETVKKARRNKKSLSGDNFYGNRLATLRADATNAFAELAATSAGDTSAIAELIEVTFAPRTSQKDRLEAVRELSHNLRTIWKSDAVVATDAGIIPLSILTEAKRGYLVTIGRQMNGCYTAGWYDAAAVMMRRLVEIAIIEAFEAKGRADVISDGDGNYLQLTALVGKTLAEPSITLSRNAKTALPQLRDVGHMSAHGRYFTAKKSDIEPLKQGCRVVVEELLHHAGLL
jgi:hypothetical protein